MWSASVVRPGPNISLLGWSYDIHSLGGLEHSPYRRGQTEYQSGSRGEIKQSQAKTTLVMLRVDVVWTNQIEDR